MTNLPISLKLKIIKYSDDSCHPVYLNMKQLKGEMTMDSIIEYKNQKRIKKDKLIRQIEKTNVKKPSDIKIYNKWIPIFRKYIIDEEKNYMPIGLKRQPNYYNYIDRNFMMYLKDHPYSKRIHIDTWRDQILLYGTMIYKMKPIIFCIHIPIIEEIHDIRNYLLKTSIKNISDYTFL